MIAGTRMQFRCVYLVAGRSASRILVLLERDAQHGARYLRMQIALRRAAFA